MELEALRYQVLGAAVLERAPAQVQRLGGSCGANSIDSEETGEHFCPECAAAVKILGSPGANGPSQDAAPPTKARAGRAIQKKLEIGVADDPLEREADRIADQVMLMQRALSAGSAPAMSTY